MSFIYKIFSGNNLFNAIIIALFAVLLWLPSFMSGSLIPSQNLIPAMPFYQSISVLSEFNVLLSKIFAFIIFGMTAVFLNYLNTRFMLTTERNFLPSFFFVLITAIFPGIQELNPVLPASLFLLAALYLLFLTYKEERDSVRFFDIGLILGLGSLFYAPVIFFIILIWAGIVIMRPFYWREWIYPLLGVLTVYALIWGYYFIVWDDGEKIFQLLVLNLSPSFLFPETDNIGLIAVLYLFILIIIASIYILNAYQYRKVYIRLYFKVFFWAFLITMPIFLYNAGGSYNIVYIMSIPVVFLFSNYFATTTNKRAGGILFTLGFLFVLFMKIYEFAG